MIPASFLAALGQIGDPRFRWVLIQGVGLTLMLLVSLYALVFFGVRWLLPETVDIPWIGEVAFVEQLLSWGSLILMMILSVFLMIPVASAFTGMFLDEVADAVEAKHYPHLSPAPHVSLSENLRESITFLGVIVVANLAALVLYITPFAPFVFYGLNGFLLSREYFRMVAVRRLGRADAKSAYRRNMATIWAAGVLMAVPLTIPVMNLLIPILGAATFTHLFHKLNP
ncbi:MAG: hypothetical protein HKN27_01565 [Silicimonas sp.]|nr:hypothetical protein [Silicimonas sp.]